MWVHLTSDGIFYCTIFSFEKYKVVLWSDLSSIEMLTDNIWPFGHSNDVYEDMVGA